jgi:carbamoyl-phosphate synthase large subunit
MPKRTDIASVLVIGSGPIVIGQASEFDYSGSQACRVLRSEGMRVILVNSNPATIMTDPEFADATYVEPITAEFVAKVIEKERPDALLATLGGQTALNTAMSLAASGVLEKYGVELIGASIEAIEKGENRESFKAVVESLPPEWGAEVSRSVVCHTLDDCFAAIGELGYPVVVRPSYTMGGLGSGLAYDEGDLRRIAGSGLAASPTTEVLLEESILGWKEYELEVMRDRADNVVIVCSIENFDPMGVHTGDSITVAPAMTLTDREYQRLRDISIGVIRAVGVETGGCNIQFAVNPADGRIVVIEMNPRVSRSSALASKATGFPIAKIAARLAIGYTLDEIPNDITAKTPASFEPTLDYVVVKVPRFAFEKFPLADATLTTHMKSVGEAMAIGRNFAEALNKALRSLERADSILRWPADVGPKEPLLRAVGSPSEDRLSLVMDALRAGATAQQVQEATGIDPWFVDQLALIAEVARAVTDADELSPAGAAAGQAARVLRRPGRRPPRPARGRRAWRPARPGHRPVYKTVDTCAAEFAARTPVPLLQLRRGDRGAAARASGGADPRQRAEPDRAGHRVRLLLRARLPGAVGGRLRDRDGQLQPRDRLHRLRHLRPALLRAAHARGRPRDRVRRAARRSGRRRHRAARRADAAGPGAGTAGRRRPDRRDVAGRDPPRGGARRLRAGAGPGRAAGAQARHGHLLRRGQDDRRRDRLPGPGAPLLRARRSRDGDRLR